MDLYIYSDESGVLDYIHNDYYVFGGVLFLGKDEKDVAERKYIHAEKIIRMNSNYKQSDELKAARVSNKEKGKLFRSLNNYYKFAVVVEQQKIHKNIFGDKKSKQRYLDYVYKIGLKNLLKKLIKNNVIDIDNIGTMHIYADEHTTATNGKYELREALLQEYKYGTFTHDFTAHFPPIIPKMQGIDLKYCNSETTTLIRATDIIANRIYFLACNNKLSKTDDKENLVITFQP